MRKNEIQILQWGRGWKKIKNWQVITYQSILIFRNYIIHLNLITSECLKARKGLISPLSPKRQLRDDDVKSLFLFSTLLLLFLWQQKNFLQWSIQYMDPSSAIAASEGYIAGPVCLPALEKETSQSKSHGSVRLLLTFLSSQKPNLIPLYTPPILLL